MSGTSLRAGAAAALLACSAGRPARLFAQDKRGPGAQGRKTEVDWRSTRPDIDPAQRIKACVNHVAAEDLLAGNADTTPPRLIRYAYCMGGSRRSEEACNRLKEPERARECREKISSLISLAMLVQGAPVEVLVAHFPQGKGDSSMTQRQMAEAVIEMYKTKRPPSRGPWARGRKGFPAFLLGKAACSNRDCVKDAIELEAIESGSAKRCPANDDACRGFLGGSRACAPLESALKIAYCKSTAAKMSGIVDPKKNLNWRKRGGGHGRQEN